MTATLETFNTTQRGQGDVQGRAQATFNAEGDVTSWRYFTGGNLAYTFNGPADAATLAVQFSPIDPSAADAPLPVEVADETGDPFEGAIMGFIPNAPPGWYRLINQATFGPAADVTNRTLNALAAAINGKQASPVNGFAPGTAPQPLVVATRPTALTMLLTAATAGVAGNSIATTETLTNGAFGAATLLNGAEPATGDGLLTFVANPTAGMTVTIGATVYTFRAAVAAAYDVLIGADAEASRDNLIEAITAVGDSAVGTLTMAANATAGDIVRIGPYYYRFVASLTGAVPFDVLRGAAATNSLDNLIAAVNSAAGAGTTYANNTPPNPDVSAAAGTGDTMDVTSRYSGADANLVMTTETGAQMSWGALTLSGATGAGVTYGEGTEEHPTVDVTAVGADEIDAEAKTAGVAGNSIATLDTLTDVKATGTLTFTPGTITTQKFRIGNVFYIFAADPTSDPAADGTTANPWQVDVGVDATASLANLNAAVNATGVAGTTYSTALVANPLVESTASSATTVSLRSILAGDVGNSYQTVVVSGAGFAFGAATLTGGGGSWGAATLTGGADAVAATGTLTMSGVFVTSNTVTIGAVVYTAKTALTPTPGEVMIAGIQMQVDLQGPTNTNYAQN